MSVRDRNDKYPARVLCDSDNSLPSFFLSYKLCHGKACHKILVVVIPKEGLAWPRGPANPFERGHTKRRIDRAIFWYGNDEVLKMLYLIGPVNRGFINFQKWYGRQRYMSLGSGFSSIPFFGNLHTLGLQRMQILQVL